MSRRTGGWQDVKVVLIAAAVAVGRPLGRVSAGRKPLGVWQRMQEDVESEVLLDGLLRGVDWARDLRESRQVEMEGEQSVLPSISCASRTGLAKSWWVCGSGPHGGTRIIVCAPQLGQSRPRHYLMASFMLPRPCPQDERSLAVALFYRLRWSYQ